MTKKQISDNDIERVKRMYSKDLSFAVIQNLTGIPSEEASRIVKEAGLFNQNKQRDYFREQVKNKRAY